MNLQGFRPIKDFEERYLISACGEVYSVKSKKILKPMRTDRGYLSVELWCDYKRKVKKLHQLVAENFIPNPNNFKEINHKDGNKDNNFVENLEWCTRSANMKHAYQHGLRGSRKGISRNKKTI